ADITNQSQPSSILALWVPQGSWAALCIQKIPEHPQKNQDLLLSVQGIPDTFQDLNWYLGEEAYGGTMLFTYILDLQRPQRDGSAMGQRDIVGFPSGSMLLHRVQPTDSGTYQVAVTINPAWTMRAKTKVQVDGECCPRSQRCAPITMPPVPPLSSASGDENIYEVILLVSPLSDTGRSGPHRTLTLTPRTHNPLYSLPHQDLLNPDPAPYCQLMPRP
uniref:Immunoglobulin V-set domain-containing protein n=1 Tax=Suricata suricatta TaxID=37032 RepID=A0A673UTH8_SURSU